MIIKNSPRSYTIDISNNKTIQTPFFCPSISTIKTNFKPLDYLDLINRIGYPGFLFSAYDIYKMNLGERKLFLKLLSDNHTKKLIRILDNGNYEAYWYRDSSWNLKQFKFILANLQIDICFSFDVFWNSDSRINQHIDRTIDLLAKSASFQKYGITIPIIHSTPDLIPRIIRKVANRVCPEIIAVPERELGSNLLERAQTVRKIRDELDKLSISIPLHLLGTGNPISILVFSLCGADMFDGLEWCTTVVNPKTGHLFHFSQKDIINCDCKACRLDRIPYHIKTMAHNLIFYEKYLNDIRISANKNNFDELINDFIPVSVRSKIKELMVSIV